MAPDIGDVLNVFVYQSTNARNVTVLALHLRRRHVVPLDPGLNRARQIVSVRKNGIDMFDQMARLQLPRVLFNRLESSARDLFGVSVNLTEVVLKAAGTLKHSLQIVRYALNQLVVVFSYAFVS